MADYTVLIIGETDDLDGLLECCQIVARTGDRVEVRPNVDPASRPGEGV